MEAAPRLDRRADDDELRTPLGRHPRDLLAEAPRPRADELVPHADAVRAGHRGRRLEPLLQAYELFVEVRVDRQLTLEDCRRHQDDPGSTIGSEPARKVERVLRLLPIEQRHDDGAVRNRAGQARKATRAVMEDVEVRELHRSNWYGTETRITFGSKSSSRLR